MKRAFSIRGTPDYMAPEILTKRGHGFGVDWWALGTIAYEMLCGEPPFFDEDQGQMFKRIMKDGVNFPDDIDLSDHCKDLITRLLDKNQSTRLGADKDFMEVLGHPFF